MLGVRKVSIGLVMCPQMSSNIELKFQVLHRKQIEKVD